MAREAAALAPDVRVVNIPPGVDSLRFRPPAGDAERRALRARWGLHPEDEAVLHLSRLVPRKGADVLIKAAAGVVRRRPNLVVLVAGGGRDEARLRRLAVRTNAPVRFLGRVDEDDKPGLYGACDVFSHVCRNRWFGLEQEGFGIIFLEAGGVRDGCYRRSVGRCRGCGRRRGDRTRRRPAHAGGRSRPGTRDAPGRSRPGHGVGCGLPATHRSRVRLRRPRPTACRGAHVTSQGIVRASLVTTIVFSTTALFGVVVDAARPVALVVALGLFVAGTGGMLAAVVIAAGRSRRDAIGIGGLFFLSGSAPPSVRRVLQSCLGAQVLVALATAVARPYSSAAFGVLAPVAGLAACGLWAARFGEFAPRAETNEVGPRK